MTEPKTRTKIAREEVRFLEVSLFPLDHISGVLKVRVRLALMFNPFEELLTLGFSTANSVSEGSVYIKRLTEEKEQENKREMLAREKDLICVSPILKGFALKNKLWRES